MKEAQSVGVVLFKDNNVLLVRNGPASSHFEGESGLPSGKVEPGETREQTVIRELQGKTGLMASTESLHFIKTFTAIIETKNGPIKYIWHTFLCTSFFGELTSSDDSAPFWEKTDELKNLQNLLPNTEEAVKLAESIIS